MEKSIPNHAHRYTVFTMGVGIGALRSPMPTFYDRRATALQLHVIMTQVNKQIVLFVHPHTHISKTYKLLHKKVVFTSDHTIKFRSDGNVTICWCKNHLKYTEKKSLVKHQNAKLWTYLYLKTVLVDIH